VLSTGALSTPASPTPPTLLRFRRIGATTFITTRVGSPHSSPTASIYSTTAQIRGPRNAGGGVHEAAR
jgi:hypothetical protein